MTSGLELFASGEKRFERCFGGSELHELQTVSSLDEKLSVSQAVLCCTKSDA
jgi:hypothetical protein